ncbi:MAG: phosphoribosylaminoimidazole-succinocarboxamide synthase [Chloroflexi bacterium]|nr:phosphoribosylaminoimidazole-succinocarboxamide synthase [Chloroflexota bacterium]
MNFSVASSTQADRHPQVGGLPCVYSGKVRDTYAAGEDRLLLVASDRLSAFDCILPTGIPNKGRVLTQLSAFWFGLTAADVPNHLISVDWDVIARETGLDPSQAQLKGRSSLVKRAQRLDVECVVRGYLAGSGWVEYCEHGTLAGVPLPKGLRECDALPEPAFTPAIKNDEGHDENISVAHLIELVGADVATELEVTSRAIYDRARTYALQRGIIVADTKFEFGLVQGKLILIDELLTPDSSRFWPVEQYKPGGAQPSFDKQPVRDFLVASGWNRMPPAPALPDEVTAATEARYTAAYSLLTGRQIDG